MIEPLLEARGLYVSRDGLPVLRDVWLRVDPGESVAVLGGNGSGKTTLIRTVLGLLPHQAGTVDLFGTPLARFREWSRIGYVPQHSTLNVTAATVREVVESGRLAHKTPFVPMGRADRSAVMAALETVGLSDRSGWPVSALSGGQRQRALIARALTTGPELLVMDEPFAGVDLHSQTGLAELLRRLKADGLGMAAVLHEIGPMDSVLTRSITLCDGRVVPAEVAAVGGGCDPRLEGASSVGLQDPIAGGRR